ncbi:hypothetical protein TcYC6_0033010 [Trypanosoma cruzi]|nr:hypothetical protein TcYC6_0033010 [Trypanosoma cruzi]
MTSTAILGCCAPFTLTAGIILFTFAAFMQHGNWTFEVLSAKEGWSLDEKAACCRNAAIFYIVLSAVLWVSLYLMRLFGKEGRKQEQLRFVSDANGRVHNTTNDDSADDDDDYGKNERAGCRRYQSVSPFLREGAVLASKEWTLGDKDVSLLKAHA